MSVFRVEVPNDGGLVLDLDDTLFAERSFHESGFRWIAQQASLDPFGPEVLAAGRELRRPCGRPLDLLSSITNIPVSTLLDWHRNHMPDITLYPDALRLLARTRLAGIPVALLTDGRSTTQRNKLAALHATDYFSHILISEEIGMSKGNLASFRLAQVRIGTDKVVGVGDNPIKDLLGPLTLGWRTSLLRDRGDNVHAQFLDPSLAVCVTPLTTLDEVGV